MCLREGGDLNRIDVSGCVMREGEGGMVFCVRAKEVSRLFSLDEGARINRRAVGMG